MLVSSTDSIFIQCDNRIILLFPTDNSIQIQIRWMTVVSVRNDIIVSSDGDITVPKLSRSLVGSIYIVYTTTIRFELSTDTSIEIQIIWTTVVSVLNYIIEPG